MKIYRARGKPTQVVSLTSYAYMPLSFSSPENAPAIIKSIEDEVEALKRSGSLPPGLAEQYDIQLKNLRDEQIADCEVVAVPWFFAGNGMLSQFYTRFWKINERISAPPGQGKKHVTSQTS